MCVYEKGRVCVCVCVCAMCLCIHVCGVCGLWCVCVCVRVGVPSLVAVSLQLSELGMAQYREAFRRNAIDGAELASLTHDALQGALGVGTSRVTSRHVSVVFHASSRLVSPKQRSL